MSASYGQYCPISRGAEIFATRWTPIVVRNLLLGCDSFGEILDGAPGMSRSLLAQRLRMLEHNGIVERRVEGRDVRYELTEAGRALAPVCDALGTWGARWLDLAPERLDSGIVLWALCRSLEPERLPRERLTVRFELPRAPVERLWLLAEPSGAEVCRTPPTDSDDAVVRTSPDALYRWYVGDLRLGDALHAGLWKVDAPRDVERLLADWCGAGGADLAAAAGVAP